jgi:hypothetical protein
MNANTFVINFAVAFRNLNFTRFPLPDMDTGE